MCVFVCVFVFKCVHGFVYCSLCVCSCVVVFVCLFVRLCVSVIVCLFGAVVVVWL